MYSLLFPKIYDRTNRFGINKKLLFDFTFTNWRHHKNNLVLPTPTKNKVVEQPIKKIIPEIDTNNKNNKMSKIKNKFHALEKGLKATKKGLLIPLSKNQRKIMRC